MANKVLGHYRKIPTAIGLRNVLAHNCRESVYDHDGKPLPDHPLPDYIIHPERARWNEGERCGASVILKRRTERLTAANLPRKVQGNASVAIEGNYSASEPWFAEHPDPNEWVRFFRDIRDLLSDRFGKENILHWAVHYDERTPHMHILFIPLTHNQQKKPTKQERQADPTCKTKYVQSPEPRYSSSNFLGGKPGLEMLQDELYERIGKPRGLERGVRGSTARHTDQYGWAAKNARDREELDRREKELELRESKAAYLRRIHEEALVVLNAENPAVLQRVRELEELRVKLFRIDEMIRSEDSAGIDDYRRALLEADRKAREAMAKSKSRSKDRDDRSY